MDSSNNNLLNDFTTINGKEQFIEKEVDNWNQKQNKLEKIKIQIKYTTDLQIVYLKDGTILRIEQSHDTLKDTDILTNMEQIQFLYWQGQYGSNNDRQGKWIAFWNQTILINAGGYYQDSKKQGLWQDLSKGFWSQAEIFETGDYFNGIRMGLWTFFYQSLMIAGGCYNEHGQKKGKWIDLDEGFYEYRQVTNNGHYNNKGLKVGIWDIMYCRQYENEYKQIGGGSYDYEGNQIKIGKWIELQKNFQYYAQITYRGEYNLKGMKIGIWDIMFCKYKKKEYIQIGGGSYDQDGNEKKIGKWIELWENFNSFIKIKFTGQYNMNGKKVDRWDIMHSMERIKGYKQIGGGQYTSDGYQKKIGKWVDLDEDFKLDKQITYNGSYNLEGKKVGRWNIMYCKSYELDYQEIMKIYLVVGDHTMKREIKKRLEGGLNYVQGFLRGNKSLMKVIIIYRARRLADGTLCFVVGVVENITKCKKGGGSYDQEGNQKKIGKWIELSEGFQFDFFNSIIVTDNGEYDINGKKFGLWVEMDIEINKNI